MYTIDTAIESLHKYDIRETDIQNWEKALNLDIPVDEYGRKQYSPHHINLFKNIKKHIALGRTLDEIKQIISLPASAPMRGEQTGTAANASKQVQARVINKSPYASAPKAPNLRADNASAGGAANVVNLVQRLGREKDQLYKKLMETEKLNSHLYSANNLYNRKVKELSAQITGLRDRLKDNENFKLLDDKDKLHKQLIAAEKLVQFKDDELRNMRREMGLLKNTTKTLETRIETLKAPTNPERFRGDWLESGKLVEVIYDNFGINVEVDRHRLFRIAERPGRVYGSTAIINTSYQYESNNLWKRNETLVVTLSDQDTLEGELIAEYILDGVPVAKATYRVTCQRQS